MLAVANAYGDEIATEELVPVSATIPATILLSTRCVLPHVTRLSPLCFGGRDRRDLRRRGDEAGSGARPTPWHRSRL